MNRSVELDRESAECILASFAPDATVKTVSRLPGGRSESVFAVRTEGEGRDVVIKFYPGEWGWMVRKEAFALDIVRQRSPELPVPIVLAADESKAVLPHSFIVMTKLEGRHPEVDDAAAAADFNRKAGALLRNLHAIELDAFGYLGGDGIVDPHQRNLDYMHAQVERNARALRDDELRRAFERHLSEREALLDGATACYCHNDCHPGNVLMRGSSTDWEISGLIDFENVVAADPLLDLAKTHYYSSVRSEATLDALAAAYGPLRDGWREALYVYVVYHAVELWVWFASLGQRDALAPIAEDIRCLLTGKRLPQAFAHAYR